MELSHSFAITEDAKRSYHGMGQTTNESLYHIQPIMFPFLGHWPPLGDRECGLVDVTYSIYLARVMIFIAKIFNFQWHLSALS